MPNLNDFAENGVLRAALSHGVRPLGGTQIMPVACERGCSAQAGVLEGTTASRMLRPKTPNRLRRNKHPDKHVIRLKGGTRLILYLGGEFGFLINRKPR